MMSMGLLNMKLHLRIIDGNHFAFRKVSGGPAAILSSDGRHVDIDLGELRYGERKEMLVELELDNTDAHARERALPPPGTGAGGPRRAMNATDAFVAQMGLDALAIGDSPDLADGLLERMIEEMPVFEVDGGFLDPAAGKAVSRLAHPVLLTVTLMPPAPARAPRPPPGPSDPVIVRRRMEILAGDMITRALVLVSRKNAQQAQTILGETTRVLSVVLGAVSAQLPPPGAQPGGVRNRKEILTLAAVRCIQAMLQDLQTLSEALEDNPELFAHDQRNFGAQQVGRGAVRSGCVLTRVRTAGDDPPRPEGVDRAERDRARVLDDRQLDRARDAERGLGRARPMISACSRVSFLRASFLVGLDSCTTLFSSCVPDILGHAMYACALVYAVVAPRNFRPLWKTECWTETARTA
jgi:hypothetical protein